MKIYRGIEFDRTYLTAKEMAVNAIERIYRPMEPKPIPGAGYHNCPSCGGLLTERNRHCHWCGQQLEWGKKGTS